MTKNKQRTQIKTAANPSSGLPDILSWICLHRIDVFSKQPSHIGIIFQTEKQERIAWLYLQRDLFSARIAHLSQHVQSGGQPSQHETHRVM